MNSQEAYKILELQPSATPEEIQAAFRKLAKKYHPDLNKDNPDAESKFKEINSAYQLLTNPSPRQQDFNNSVNINFQDLFNQAFGGNPFGGGFGGFGSNPAPIAPNNTTISFAESVLGVEKELEITQNQTCGVCHGNGSTSDVNNCNFCQGKGAKQASFSRGAMSFIEQCQKCKGTGKIQNPCKPCEEKGFTSIKMNKKIKIPGGVLNNNVLKIPGGFIKINVEADSDMRLEDGNVVSDINISLLEALKGTLKPVKTVKGEMNLKIPANIKNGNSVQVHGYGVEGHGSHIFNISVNYPQDTQKLIELLESE